MHVQVVGTNDRVFSSEVGLGGGQVRLGLVHEDGSVVTQRLALHDSAAHKLAPDPTCYPHCFLSAGEDGRVMHFDLRESSHRRGLLVIGRPGYRGVRPGRRVWWLVCSKNDAELLVPHAWQKQVQCWAQKLLSMLIQGNPRMALRVSSPYHHCTLAS